MNSNINMEVIEAVKAIKTVYNDAYRVTDDSNRSEYIFDNQIESAKELLIGMSRHTTRSHHALLLAQMQSGKTGVCNAVVNILNTGIDTLMGIQKYIFVTGMNDCGLKKQTYERLIAQTFDANEDNVALKYKNTLSKYFIMKNSDLMKYEGNLENTILFIDESHYGSNERNILTQFMAKHGIDWKNTNGLLEKNTYVISVSATPFDEIVSDKANCKTMVELKTSDSYVGISTYLENDLIKEANATDVTSGEIFNYIEDAYNRMMAKNVSGVILIRTRFFDAIEVNPFVATNFDVLEMQSSSSNIDYSSFNDTIANLIRANEEGKDVKPLIVLIKGAFRAGITIPANYKDYIFMVYDYSLKAETTAQALLGRMCGYRNIENGGVTNTIFYINKKFADMYSDWSNDIQNRDMIPYNKETWAWVDDSYEGNTEIGSKSCGNFAINLTDDELYDLYGRIYGKHNKVNVMESEFPKILASKGINCDYDYIMEAIMNGKNHYKESSHLRRFDKFSKDLVVFPFRAEKCKKFQKDTNRDYLTKEDLGKKCVSFVLDTNINVNKDGYLEFTGNKRILVYYVEVAQKAKLANRESMYKLHKDTILR